MHGGEHRTMFSPCVVGVFCLLETAWAASNSLCSDVHCPSGWRMRTGADTITCTSDKDCDPTVNPGKCCLKQATCNSMTCPSGYVPKEGQEELLCSSEICGSTLDASACCTLESNFATKTGASPVQVGNATAVMLPCTNPIVHRATCSSNGAGSPISTIPLGGFTVILCPDQCTTETVYGTGAYSKSSAVCTASIHGGVISQGGGYVKVRVTAGLPIYVGSELNGILSRDGGASTESMVLSVPTAQEICDGGFVTTTTDMPWGWPWWAWFILCSSILAVPVVLGLLALCVQRGQKEVKTKKRVDAEQEILATPIDDDPVDYVEEEQPRRIVGGAVMPPLLHNYGDTSPRLPDTRRGGDRRKGRTPLALPA
mmetsp:Transcript_57421/g.134665  ORF Transcript_57421/g.134665 Transcript_57421/m.134665 type:complete len:370 (+) Transcript_57421:134-1243(+)